MKRLPSTRFRETANVLREDRRFPWRKAWIEKYPLNEYVNTRSGEQAFATSRKLVGRVICARTLPCPKEIWMHLDPHRPESFNRASLSLSNFSQPIFRISFDSFTPKAPSLPKLFHPIFSPCQPFESEHILSKMIETKGRIKKKKIADRRLVGKG